MSFDNNNEKPALADAQPVAGATGALLPFIPQPAFVLDRTGALLANNATAREYLETARCLVLTAGRLQGAHGHARAVQALVEGCATASYRGGSDAVRYATLEHQGSRVLLAGSPLPSPGGTTLLVVFDSQWRQPSTSRVQQFRGLFGFTGAEALVAARILEGYSVKQIATLQATSEATVRTQVARVLAKTGMSRQADLIRLLATLPCPKSEN
ncbi:MAG TPA: helix-turn-helix transcriptional regulator [Ramlibacter sp.]|nr:helix-turn-helix transcriptional regulator [Ramlibacter sp.]